jgi:hypothetical protein
VLRKDGLGQIVLLGKSGGPERLHDLRDTVVLGLVKLLVKDIYYACRVMTRGIHAGRPTCFEQKQKATVSTHLHVFEAVLLADAPQYVLLAALLHLSGKQKLIKYKVCLLEIEDDVQLADVAIVFVHLLDEAVDDLEGDELVVR